MALPGTVPEFCTQNWRCARAWPDMAFPEWVHVVVLSMHIFPEIPPNLSLAARIERFTTSAPSRTTVSEWTRSINNNNIANFKAVIQALLERKTAYTRQSTFTPEDGKTLIDAVHNNPSITISELQHRFLPHLGRTTIWEHLHMLEYSHEKLRRQVMLTQEHA